MRILRSGRSGKFKTGVSMLLAAAACVCAASAVADAQRLWMNTELSPDKRATALEKRMTLAEKLRLLHGYPAGLMSDTEAALGSAGYVPGVRRLDIPALQETDASLGVANPDEVREDGRATALPSGLALAATFDPRLAYQSGAMIGREAWRIGFNVLLAGGVNLARDPRGGRNFEYFGEDPLLAGTLAGATVRGIQNQHVIATVKHFALNDQETRRRYADAIIGEAAMRESDLLAFEIAIEQGHPGAVMCAYNLVNGVHACGNRHLLSGILKGDWHYAGFVMSDWGAVHAVTDALAGLDQESAARFDRRIWFGKPLRNALKTGAVPQSRIDDMVHRILRSMFAVGLFDHPPQRGKIDYAANAAVTRRVADAGIVLLKNAHHILPLAAATPRIAVIGGRADLGVISGGGSSQVLPMSPDGQFPSVSIDGGPDGHALSGTLVLDPDAPLNAIREAAPRADVRYDDGRDPASARALARWADVAIVFATQWQKEGADAPNLSLPHDQDALIAAIAAANSRTIVVLETGNPVAMPWLDKIAGLVEAWYSGQRGGSAIADVLFGAVDPSGHLPITFPKSVAQEPRPRIPGRGHAAPRQRIKVDYRVEGARVGYRWFADQHLTPLFPFGFGLSYTSFDYADLQVASGRTLTVSFDVTNTGRRTGAAVPQIYLTSQAGRKLKRLIGFKRVALRPGQTRHITLTADPRLLADFDTAARAWRIPAGKYTIMLGRSATAPVATASARLESRTLPP